MVIFNPKEPAPGFPRRPGKAPFREDGYFTAGTFTEDDGLMPGVYYVTIFCGEPVEGMQSPGKSYVPAKFQSPAQSGLLVELSPDSDAVQLEYDIPRAE